MDFFQSMLLVGKVILNSQKQFVRQKYLFFKTKTKKF